MRKSWRIFNWMCRPQAVVGFVVICLCVSACSSMLRPHGGTSQSHFGSARPPAPAFIAPHVDCAAKPCIALTFDDGPNPAVTPHILDILAQQQVKATFFVVGMRVAGNEHMLQREYREGHEIGNHSWSHPDLSKLTTEEAEQQIQATQQAIAMAGVPAPRILRPPYGAVDTAVLAHSNLSIVRWNVDPEDWKNQDPPKIFEQVMTHVRPGAVILLHDIYPSTVAVLEPLLIALKPHYQFLTASQLLNLSPGDQGQFFGR
jgi:peptidoglycan-N-acetylglucosamine deacetylase